MDAHVKPLIVILLILLTVVPAMAQETPVDVPGASSPLGGLSASPAPRAPTTAPQQGAISASNTIAQNVPNLASPQNFSAAMQIIILLTVLSLAPAILIMMTSFTRFIIVLSLLRQALGTQQLPPNQILIGLSLFMTFIVMLPTWQKINSDAVQPYMNNEISQPQALANAQVPLRNFMISQIREQKNDDDVYLFASFSGANTAEMKWKDVTTMQLIPAFMLSELKTAFLMGFTVYLPFLIVDMVISSILISMGMMMLPPVLISLPFKLLLFVLVDGWRLITGNLMGSFVNS
jgi:flagellar biosynthetic protein FliP